ncbi:MAG: hypothetical protein QM764_15305 [Chitinophagaceae bacterium]
MNPKFCYSMLKVFSIKVFIPAAILCIAMLGSAQGNNAPETGKSNADAPKPYKVLTAGKRITVQSKTEISKVMVWTSRGNRVVEQDNIKSATYTFNVTARESFVFIMLELKDGKRYTEKIGVQ